MDSSFRLMFERGFSDRGAERPAEASRPSINVGAVLAGAALGKIRRSATEWTRVVERRRVVSPFEALGAAPATDPLAEIGPVSGSWGCSR